MDWFYKKVAEQVSKMMPEVGSLSPASGEGDNRQSVREGSPGRRRSDSAEESKSLSESRKAEKREVEVESQKLILRPQSLEELKEFSQQPEEELKDIKKLDVSAIILKEKEEDEFFRALTALTSKTSGIKEMHFGLVDGHWYYEEAMPETIETITFKSIDLPKEKNSLDLTKYKNLKTVIIKTTQYNSAKDSEIDVNSDVKVTILDGSNRVKVIKPDAASSLNAYELFENQKKELLKQVQSSVAAVRATNFGIAEPENLKEEEGILAETRFPELNNDKGTIIENMENLVSLLSSGDRGMRASITCLDISNIPPKDLVDTEGIFQAINDQLPNLKEIRLGDVTARIEPQNAFEERLKCLEKVEILRINKLESNSVFLTRGQTMKNLKTIYVKSAKDRGIKTELGSNIKIVVDELIITNAEGAKRLIYPQGTEIGIFYGQGFVCDATWNEYLRELSNIQQGQKITSFKISQFKGDKPMDLSYMPSIQRLELESAQFTDSGELDLTKNPHLKELVVACTEKSLKKIKCLPQVKIIWKKLG